jgi:putative addiction module killer protein
MEPRRRRLLIYTDARGRQPLTRWLDALKDGKARGAIKARIARLEGGNFGDVRPVGESVQELRIHHGAGYRVYFAEADDVLILLLCGGSKAGQERDIARAKLFWNEAQGTL